MKAPGRCDKCSHDGLIVSIGVNYELASVIELPDRKMISGTWPGKITCPSCKWSIPMLASHVEESADGQIGCFMEPLDDEP